MSTIHSDAFTFNGPVTFGGAVTFADDPPSFILENITDLVVGDDLTVIDDATIGGDLSVTGASTLGAVACATLSVVTSLTVTGASIVGLHEHLTLDVANLSGTTTYGVPCPVAGVVTKIWSRLKGALSVGDATLTAAIGATPITNGVITIAQGGSAAGDIDSATPSAANTVAVGSDLNVTVGGSNGAVVGATVVFQIRRTA